MVEQRKSEIHSRKGSRKGKTSTVGALEVQTWSPAQLNQRAVITFCACWGLALASIFLPLVHFVLVPGFFVLGPVAASFIRRQKATILGGQGECPDCGQSFRIARQTLASRFLESCEHCRSEVEVVVTPATG